MNIPYCETCQRNKKFASDTNGYYFWICGELGWTDEQFQENWKRLNKEAKDELTIHEKDHWMNK
jgi:hypothetical protein